MKVLLDTNAYSALMADRGRVTDMVRRADAVFLSAVVLGELLFGFRNGTRYNENRAQLDTFLSRSFVQSIEVTLETAERFGLIATQLRRCGTPLNRRCLDHRDGVRRTSLVLRPAFRGGRGPAVESPRRVVETLPNTREQLHSRMGFEAEDRLWVRRARGGVLATFPAAANSVGSSPARGVPTAVLATWVIHPSTRFGMRVAYAAKR